MSLPDILDGALTAAGTAALAAYYALERHPNAKFSRRIAQYLQRPPKSLGALNSRKQLTLEEFALIEKFVPKLDSVVIVCNVIEEPTRDLLNAVIDNFQKGARYTFFVSRDGHRDQELEEYQKWFEAIYTVAHKCAPPSGEKSLIHNLKFPELFSIQRLPSLWLNVPYVFYNYHVDSQDQKDTIALKGTRPGVGISEEYLRVAVTEAQAIYDLCSMASSDFRLTFGASTPRLADRLPNSKVPPDGIGNIINVDRRAA